MKGLFLFLVPAFADTVTSLIKTTGTCPSECRTTFQECQTALEKKSYPDCVARGTVVFNFTDSSIDLCQSDKGIYYSEEPPENDPDAVTYSSYLSSAISFKSDAFKTIDYRVSGFKGGSLILHLATPVKNSCDLVLFELKTRGGISTTSEACNLPIDGTAIVRSTMLLLAGSRDIEVPLNTDDARQYYGLTGTSTTCANFTGATLQYKNITVEVELNPLFDPYVEEKAGSLAKQTEGVTSAMIFGLLSSSLALML
eukprot:Blabericola_migrator_1__13247@NODE_920_length_6047_cov_182_670736_g639_i1_p3_GENE_NODE_920_length_6047_cov_182_670736_g639_i1NODE_920_length_6047_cov_182_670736_g639_i1_p3_ORF_typecomplete_len255_score35_77_NODE_920_length_6047_cov_182_670736_g639_i110561820